MSPLFLLQFVIVASAFALLINRLKPWRASYEGRTLLFWILAIPYGLSGTGAVAYLAFTFHFLDQAWLLMFAFTALTYFAYRLMRRADRTPNAVSPYPATFSTLSMLSSVIIGLAMSFGLIAKYAEPAFRRMSPQELAAGGGFIAPVLILGGFFLCHHLYFHFQRRTVYLVVGIVVLLTLYLRFF